MLMSTFVKEKLSNIYWQIRRMLSNPGGNLPTQLVMTANSEHKGILIVASLIIQMRSSKIWQKEEVTRKVNNISSGCSGQSICFGATISRKYIREPAYRSLLFRNSLKY